VVLSPDPQRVREQLAPLMAEGIERLLAFGGDGSAHLLANLVLDAGLGASVPIGLVPVGTGGDLARPLGLPRDPLAALQRALSSPPRPVDALRLTTDDGRRRFVLNVASAGISGLVDEAVNAVPGRGQAAYFMATLAALRRYRPARCRIAVDGQSWYEGGVLLLAVANGTCFGGGMKIAPRARLDDGALDVVLVGQIPKWQLIFRLSRLYRGTHLDSGHVRWRRAREVRLEPLSPLPPFDLDGEVFPSASARFELLPAALRLLA
jgi:diacylglycerol kinase (ATP)